MRVMKSPQYQSPVVPRSHHPYLSSVILYDDRVSGVDGELFCEFLAEEIACGCKSLHSLWSLKLLDDPSIAARASVEAEASDFMVVSVSGEADLSSASRQWLGAQMTAVHPRRRFVVLLSNGSARFRDIGAGIRRWLDELCRSADVDFFSYLASPLRRGHFQTRGGDWLARGAFPERRISRSQDVAVFNETAFMEGREAQRSPVRTPGQPGVPQSCPVDVS
jgi:hypothetical protein